MVSFLHLKRPLRHDLTEERATNVMLLLSPGVYRALAVERGWTHAEWVVWISRTLVEQLFESPRRDLEAPGSSSSPVRSDPQATPGSTLVVVPCAQRPPGAPGPPLVAVRASGQ